MQAVIVHRLIEMLEQDRNEKISGPMAARLIAQAQKFELLGARFLDTEVYEYAKLLGGAGLLRLPFPLCYFETVTAQSIGAPQMGILAAQLPETDDEIYIYSYRFHKGEAFGPFVSHVTHGEGGAEYRLLSKREDFLYLEDATKEAKDEVVHGYCGDGLTILCCALAFLDLKETVIRDVAVKERVNKQRIAAGKTPFYAHKTLTINPAAKAALMSEGHRDSLIKRRAHWRRGHLRHLPGKVVPVAPALVRGEGFLPKDYRIGKP